MSIWRALKTLGELNAPRATLTCHLDIKFTEIGADCLRGTMPVDGRTMQPDGLLHGGASVVLAETLGSVAAAMCVDPEYTVVGQEINANHVRPARSGLVTGTARAVHIGRRTQVWAIDIVDEAGKLVCISRITMAVIKRR
jgi:1,4-dihydroxy-2-naphthoyl-CoA hydrolase